MVSLIERRDGSYYRRAQFLMTAPLCVFVVALLSFATITHWRLVLLVARDFSVGAALFEALLFNAAMSLSLVAYFRTLLTDPGGVPVDFSKITVTEFEYGTKQPRSCHYCRSIKPDRAHHCSSCGTCVLKMDHHCPWVNNCVGFRNHKFFALFLLYTALSAFTFLTASLPYLIIQGGVLADGGWSYFEETHQWELIVETLVLTFLGFFWGMGLLGFFLVNLMNLIQNTTTIQAMRGSDNFYDIGTKENFKATFGETAVLWCLPVMTLVGDGLHFPMRRSLSEAAFPDYNSISAATHLFRDAPAT